MFDYDEFASEAATVLDKYNLTEEIGWCIEAGCHDAYEVQQYLASLFVGSCHDKFIEALENLTLDEFREYLAARYGVEM